MAQAIPFLFFMSTWDGERMDGSLPWHMRPIYEATWTSAKEKRERESKKMKRTTSDLVCFVLLLRLALLPSFSPSLFSH